MVSCPDTFLVGTYPPDTFLVGICYPDKGERTSSS
jgi:hypothetical protein